MPDAVLRTPQDFGLTAGKTDKLKVNIDRYDDKKEPTAIKAEAPPECVTLEAATVPAIGGLVELKFVTTNETKPGKH